LKAPGIEGQRGSLQGGKTKGRGNESLKGRQRPSPRKRRDEKKSKKKKTLRKRLLSLGSKASGKRRGLVCVCLVLGGVVWGFFFDRIGDGGQEKKKGGEDKGEAWAKDPGNECFPNLRTEKGNKEKPFYRGRKREGGGVGGGQRGSN